jgi:hypothetical protein
MNPLLVLFGLDIALLGFAYWAGSLVGLGLVMVLCFAVALGLIVFSNAPIEELESSAEGRPPALDPFFSSFATLDR